VSGADKENVYAQPEAKKSKDMDPIYSLPAGYDFVLYCPYVQRWKLLGYSRGELLESIPLAPQEEVTLEVFSWDRKKEERETTSASEKETSSTSGASQKDSLEVVKDASRKKGWKVDAKAKIEVPVEDVKIGADGGGQASDEITRSARGTENSIAEATTEATARLKTTRQTKVSLTSEYGTENRTTRKIKNNNFVRTLTLDYYQMMAHYDVETVIDRAGARLCLLVDSPLPVRINRQFLLTHERVLRSVLIDADLLPAFEAVRALADFDFNRDITLRAAIDQTPKVPAGGVPYDLVHSLDVLRASVNMLAKANKRQFASEVNKVGSYTPAAADQLRLGIYRDLILKQYPHFFESLVIWADKGSSHDNPNLPLFMWALRYAPMHVKSQDELPHAMLSDFVNYLGDFPSVNAYGPALILVASTADDAGFKAAWTQVLIDLHAMNLLAESETIRDDKNLIDGPLASMLHLNEALTVVKDVNHVLGATLAPYGGDSGELDASDLRRPKPISAHAPLPSTFYGQEIATLAEAHGLESRLISHVNAYGVFYGNVVWQDLDPEVRLKLIRLRGDSINSHVRNEILGFVDGRPAMPYRIESDEEASNWFKLNVLTQDEEDGVKAKRVSVPTKSVSLQTRLGNCDTAEAFIMDHRTLDVEMRSAEVDLARFNAKRVEQEVRRHRMRLDLNKPDLSDPEVDSSIHVRLDQDSK
jgi:hypothetical protein